MYTIRFLFLLTLIVAVLVAIFTSGNMFLSETVRLILLANGLGALVAVVVTFVFRFPRDGSFRGNYDDKENDEIESESTLDGDREVEEELDCEGERRCD